MAMTYQNFASLGVNLNRQKYGPLDISNVFTSENDLRYYLTKGAHTEGVSEYWYKDANNKVVPYPYEGQVLATVIDNAVNVYVLALDKNGAFITQEIGGKVAVDDTTVEIGADGKLTIKGFSTAATTSLPCRNAYGELEWVTIDALVENDTDTKTEIVIADGSALKLVSKVKDDETNTYTYTLDVTLPTQAEYAIAKSVADDGTVSYALTKDGVAIGDAIEIPEGYDDTELAGRVTSLESVVEANTGKIDTVKKQVDDFFAAADLTEKAIDTLTEIQTYIENDETAAGNIAQQLGSHETAITTLTGDENTSGSVAKTVKDAITAQQQLNDANYATNDALDAVSAKANAAAVKTEVESALAGKVDTATLDEYYTKNESYSRDEIDNKLKNLSAEGTADAGLVQANLEQHMSDSDARFDAVEAALSTAEEAIQLHATEIESINDPSTGLLKQAEGKINTKVSDAITSLKNNEVATIEANVGKNTGDITSLNSQVTGINANITSIQTELGNLKQSDSTLTGEIARVEGKHDNLATTVQGHASAIGDLQAAAEGLQSSVDGLTSKFNDYSTTEQVEQLIEDAVAGIDTSDLSDLIAANTAAIEAEVKRSTEKDAEIAASLETQSAAIDSINATLGAITNTDDGDSTLESIKELATWVSEHETEVLPKIQENADAIALLNSGADTVGSVRNIVAEAIGDIPMATADKLGLVKLGGGEIGTDVDGTLIISEVSTDKLVNGSKTLVLNGGSATSN